MMFGEKPYRYLSAALLIGSFLYLGATLPNTSAPFTGVASPVASCSQLMAEYKTLGDFSAQHAGSLMLVYLFVFVCVVNGFVLFLKKLCSILCLLGGAIYESFHRRAL